MKMIKLEKLKINPFELIGKGWMVISAGDSKSNNMMTASWGHLGALWGHGINGKPTAEVFVRPSRYTDKFIQKNDYFVLSFFDHKKFQKDLLYLGSVSGRGKNKILDTKLHIVMQDKLPCFNEAQLTLICKKIYKGKIKKEGFLDKKIIKEFYTSNFSNNPYSNNSWHNVYVGEIVAAYKN